MPIPATPLRRNDRGPAVAALHRTLEILNRKIDPRERDARVLGPATEAVVRDYQKAAAIPTTGIYDDATRDRFVVQLADIGPYSVYGRVTDADGDPVIGATVFAVDVDLRRNEVLGQSTTDSGGDYEVRYAASKFTRAEKASADLVVRAVLGDQQVAESPTLFDAPVEARIDLASATRHGVSEYERLVAEVMPLLDGTPIAELADTDVEFLAGETGLASARWLAFVRAQRLSAAQKLPAEAFYAWLRAGLAAEWDALVQVRATVLRDALVDAIARAVIPAWSDEMIDKVLSAIPNSDAKDAGALLGATISGDTTKKLAGAIDSLDAVSDATLTRLVDASTIDAKEADRVGLAVSLQRLASPDPAVVAKLLDIELSTGKLVHARQLAQLSPADWETALANAGAPVSTAQARDLAIHVAAAYPDDAFRAQARIPLEGADTERSARLIGVIGRNPDVAFTQLDYLPGSTGVAQIDFGDLDAPARKQVVADLHAQARLHSVTGNAVTARELQRGGMSSASQIATSTPAELATKTGISAEDAFAFHTTATQIANDAAITWFGIYDATRDRYTTPVQVIPSHDQFFRALDGYAQLANDQPWCECEDCQSVLSPAAYFVDLMSYIERYILAGSFAGRTDHPLHLEKRRPDLWELPLTCANTKELVPALDLVNEILARYLRTVLPVADNTALFEVLANGEASLAQPFTLPLERLTILLGHFQLTRYAVAKAMRVDAATQARARLRLTPKAYALVTTERLAAPYLLSLFRIQSTVTAPDTALAQVELAALVDAVDVSHDTLAAALVTPFVTGTTLPAIAIAFGKRDDADVQNNLEVVQNLTLRRLDRLHRFLRLWRTTPWTITELDEVLARLATPAVIDATTPEKIVALLELDPALSVEEVLALAGAYPERALRDPVALFDRLFNPAAFVARDGAWQPNLARRFTHPAWTARTGGAVGRSIPADNTLGRLLAGLQLSDAELVELVAGLGAMPALDHRAATTTEDESIALTRASLVALYRYARLRRLLGCTIAELLSLVKLANLPTGWLASLDDLRAVRDFAAWQKTCGFSLDRLALLTDTSLPGAIDPVTFASDLIAAIAAEHSLEFADTLFAGIGLTEAESRELVAANVAPDPASALPFELATTGYRIRAIGTTGLAIPASLAPRVTEAEARSALANFDAIHVLDVALGVALGRTLDEISSLRTIADPLGAADEAAVVRALQTGTPGADRDRLVVLVARTTRTATLLQAPVFDAAGLQVVVTRPAVLFRATPIATVRAVAAYRGLAAAKDSGFTTESAPPARAALDRVVGDLAHASDADVAAALRTDEARIAGLRASIALPADPFDALAALADALAIANTLGVSGETLQRIVAETTAALGQAAEDVGAAIRAKYPDEATQLAKLEPFEDMVRTRTRDGLVDYLLTRWPTPFANPNKLYEYFLVDVMVQGCARTSRVLAATASLQLYVHRAIMNLERSADDAVHAVFSDAAKRGEWDWRKHYRVWEANRRVFLYPENYLEPELRDDKTPLFEELEDALLMQEFDKASVLDAYSRYLSGFDELARLSIAGAFYDAGARKLHLFGVTQDDAPVYYYRELTDVDTVTSATEAPTFSAWHKLPLQIPVRRVSPVMFAGRLYLFWVETTTRPINTFKDGASKFGGYRHTLRIRFSTLRLDGAWSAPQLVAFVDSMGRSDSEIIQDPIDDERKQKLVDQRTAIQQDLDKPERQTELTNARNKARDAANAAADATRARISSQQAVDRFPDDGEKAAIAVAGVVGGPGAALAVSSTLLTARVATLALIALIERQRLDELRSANDLRDRKEAEANALQRQIDQLTFTINHLKIYVRWDPSWRDHTEALDSYKPDGWAWERIYPEVVGDALRITVVPRNAPHPSATDEETVAYFANHLRPLRLTTSDFAPSPGALRDRDGDSLITDWTTALNWKAGFIQRAQVTSSWNSQFAGQAFYSAAYWLNYPEVTAQVVALAPPTADLQVVNGAARSVVVEDRGDSVWLRPTPTGGYAGTRLTTDLIPTLATELWRGGVDALLDGAFQSTLAEQRSTISPIVDQAVAGRPSPFHANNPERTYFRETFFHIPFSIANHLNSEGKFADTQQWYHHIFDPTAATGDPWRYREFRELPPTTTLRAILTDPKALAAYRAHPFSPHAIARTRLTAYQKSIVMKYVDNLLDWGDMLFDQFTMESITEATMLYVMAQDILGPRPTTLGSCGEGKVSPKDYRTIRAGMSDVSDFLVELEAAPKVSTTPVDRQPPPRVVPKPVMKQRAARVPRMLVAGPAVTTPVPQLPWGPTPTLAGGTPVMVHELQTGAGTYWTSKGKMSLTPEVVTDVGAGLDHGTGLPGTRGGTVVYPADPGTTGGVIPFGEIKPIDVEYTLQDLDPGGTKVTTHVPPGYHHPPIDIVPPKQPVFCIPPNADLLAYWSRVEDRLFKIRNCMDITGARRQVELFSPSIDPRLLVRMTAAGLSIDDVLNSTSGNLPPYRFTYLIEKARQHASTVQAFGAQLLSAFEKADAEELAHLRAVHEQNLLQMRTKLAELEITSAEDTLDGLRAQRAAVEYRRDHYASLREVGQIAGERKQQQLQGEASSFRSAAGIAQVVASILTIIPDMGAPTAMKFGGSQLGAAGRAVAEGLNALAAFSEMGASRAGVEASNQRRDQEWTHQVESARLELAQLDKSIAAAEIRRDIAVRSLDLHEQTVAQTEEMFEFFREKFSSVDRYRLLAKELRRLYRLAFNSALAMARMAEQAYRNERPGDDSVLDGNLWDAETAGLLAGERLVIELQRFERQFIESNYRELEVEHSFSLAQFAPDELAALKVTGECQFDVPEWFFDLTYPGQYRRRLKAVRLTMPCVTGPYANIGATLRLERSLIRANAPAAGQPLAALTPVALRHTVAIATSKGQNDAGVFDFNFRDERYMPFEGAGAIGTWTLTLPKALRMFDYNSISDVILHLDYTAQHDEGLEQRWDGAAGALLALLGKIDPANPPLGRVLSLRSDFPDVFHRLVASPQGTAVAFAIEQRHFPGFLAGHGVEALAASVQVITPGLALPATIVSIGRVATTQLFKPVTAGAAADIDGGLLREFELGSVMATAADPSGVPGAVIGSYLIKLATDADPKLLQDITLRIGYRLI